MKYKKGMPITSLCDAVLRIQDRKPFYWREKYLAAAFIEHWSVCQIERAIQQKVLWEAISL